MASNDTTKLEEKVRDLEDHARGLQQLLFLEVARGLALEGFVNTIIKEHPVDLDAVRSTISKRSVSLQLKYLNPSAASEISKMAIKLVDVIVQQNEGWRPDPDRVGSVAADYRVFQLPLRSVKMA